MKYPVLLCCILLSFNLFGTHIRESHFQYTYLKTLSNGNFQYRITVHYTREPKNGTIEFSDSIVFGIYNRDSHNLYKSVQAPLRHKQVFTNCYGQSLEDVTYEQIVDLEPCDSGYIAARPVCCRPESSNIRISQNGQPEQGIITYCFIPGRLSNNNPGFSIKRLLVKPSLTDTIYFYTKDPDGDSLAVEITKPSKSSVNIVNLPYILEYSKIEDQEYNTGYASKFPLGFQSTFKLDSENRRLIILCTKEGNYDVAFSIREYRAGKLVGHTVWETSVYVANTIASPVKFTPSGYTDRKPKAVLRWRNCKEDLQYQVIEKHIEGAMFQSIDTIMPADTSYEDTQVNWSTTYYYRIREVYNDKKTRYSDSVMIQFWSMGLTDQISQNILLTLSPTPVSGICHVTAGQTIYEYSVADHTGKIISRHQLAEPGMQIDIDCHNWPAGIYFISIISEGGRTTKKLLRL